MGWSLTDFTADLTGRASEPSSIHACLSESQIDRESEKHSFYEKILSFENGRDGGSNSPPRGRNSSPPLM